MSAELIWHKSLYSMEGIISTRWMSQIGIKIATQFQCLWLALLVRVSFQFQYVSTKFETPLCRWIEGTHTYTLIRRCLFHGCKEPEGGRGRGRGLVGKEIRGALEWTLDSGAAPAVLFRYFSRQFETYDARRRRLGTRLSGFVKNCITESYFRNRRVWF